MLFTSERLSRLNFLFLCLWLLSGFESPGLLWQHIKSLLCLPPFRRHHFPFLCFLSSRVRQSVWFEQCWIMTYKVHREVRKTLPLP